MTALRLRVRHGVYADPTFGYRAMRDVNGTVEWLGPWTTEARADAIARSQTQLLKDALVASGRGYTAGDTPLDIWTVATVTPQEAADA